MPKYRKGQKVRILSASIGWGNVKKGNIGVIESVDNKDAIINIPGTETAWKCMIHDLELVENSISKDNPAMIFICNIMESIQEKADSIDLEWEMPSKTKLLNSLKKIAPIDENIYSNIISKIDNISFDSLNQKIFITTKRCTIPYRVRSYEILVDIGKFNVTYDFILENVRIQQLCKDKKINQYDHPHVRNMVPCFGGYYKPIQKALKTYDICTLLSKTLDFLNSCYDRGWYHPVLSWLTQSDKNKYSDIICFGCNDTFEDCSCDSCGDCGESSCICNRCSFCALDEDSCECDMCPLSNEPLGYPFPDIHCLGCEYLNETENSYECMHRDAINLQRSK
jgi:hypothetical protein